MRRRSANGVMGLAVVISILAVASILASRDSPSIEGVYVIPPPPIQLGREVRISARVRYPPDDVQYRWRSDNGLFDPQQSRELATTYTAVRAGRDLIRLEVLGSGVTIQQDEFVVEVVAPVSARREQSDEYHPFSAPSGSVAVEITEVPPYDEVGGGVRQAGISGSVSGSTPEQRIVLYACTNVCYVQPLVADPYTDIRSDGSWSNWTHTGKIYMALLVEAGFTPPPTIAGAHISHPAVAASTAVEGRRTGSP